MMRGTFANIKIRNKMVPGDEEFDIVGVSDNLRPNKKLSISATRPDGPILSFDVLARLDSNIEVEYYANT